MLAADAWRMLKSRTHQEGIFTKLNAMHTALHTKFSFSTPTLDTLAEIKNLMARYMRVAKLLLVMNGRLF